MSKYPFKTATGTTENPRLISYSNSHLKLGYAQIVVEETVINFYVCKLSTNANTRALQITDLVDKVKTNSNYFVAGDFSTSDFNEFSAMNKLGIANVKYGENGPYNTVIGDTSAMPDNLLYHNGAWTVEIFKRGTTSSKAPSDHMFCFSTATFNAK